MHLKVAGMFRYAWSQSGQRVKSFKARRNILSLYKGTINMASRYFPQFPNSPLPPCSIPYELQKRFRPPPPLRWLISDHIRRLTIATTFFVLDVCSSPWYVFKPLPTQSSNAKSFANLIHAILRSLEKCTSFYETLTHFSPLFDFIWKPVIWFAVKIKWLFSR